jgi:hypothetical protein
MKIKSIKAVISHVLEMDDGNTYRRSLEGEWEVYWTDNTQWISIWNAYEISEACALQVDLETAMADYKDSI